MKKLISILVAFAMMATLAVSMAFAKDEEPGSGITPSADQKSADARIGKYLKVADGVVVPDVTFTFNFTAKPSDTNAAGPSIAAPTLTTIGDTPTLTATTGTTADGNSVAGSFKIADLFIKAGTTDELVFTAPGEYIYEVEESNSAGTGTSATVEGVTTTTKYTNDNSKKTVRIYVKYDNSTPAKLVIDTITITTTKDSASTKVDPDENPVTATDPSTLGNTFQNNYEKNVVIDEEHLTPNNALLAVSKAVVAPAGYVAPGQTYPFTITLTKAANDTTTGATVDAYIIGKDAEGQTTKTLKKVNVNAATTFDLADGETLAFGALPYGMTYTTEELLENSTVPNFANYTATIAASDTKTDATGKGKNVSAAGTVDEAAQDTVAVTNTLDTKDVTPEGILISNLPYIALALVAIGGLVAYVVIRRRNADEA